jgi:hypothetical protein
LHHVQHWAAGGPTSLENLVQLCGRHHRDLHEGMLSIQVNHEATGVRRFTFVDRWGNPIVPLARRPRIDHEPWEHRDLAIAGIAGLTMINVPGRGLPMDLHSTASSLFRSAS